MANRKKTEKKKTGFLGILIRAVLLLFFCYAAFNIITVQVTIHGKQAELTVMREKIEEQTQINAELSEMLANGITDEYIAKIAREHGYALPDERVYESSKIS